MKLARLFLPLIAGLVVAATPVFALQNGVPRQHGAHARISPEKKQASDANMQSGLTQLQAAASALQSGNGNGAIGSLTSAVQSFQQALPIYHGLREKAMHKADRAVKALQRNGKQSVARATALVGSAISDAQQALQVN